MNEQENRVTTALVLIATGMIALAVYFIFRA
jgi:Mg2+ and Co2+ transporter CorA